MIEQHKFILINANTILVRLNLEYITAPILWCNEGAYGLIPYPRIQNELQLHKDENKLNLTIKKPTGLFQWRNTIKISPRIANALLSGDKDDKCVYKDKNEN